jgi:hypothetical protein
LKGYFVLLQARWVKTGVSTTSYSQIKPNKKASGETISTLGTDSKMFLPCFTPLCNSFFQRIQYFDNSICCLR